MMKADWKETPILYQVLRKYATYVLFLEKSGICRHFGPSVFSQNRWRKWPCYWLHPNNKSRLSTSVSMALRHWCCVPEVYSGVCSSRVDVLKVSMGFRGFLSIFVVGEMYIQISRQNMTHAGRWKRCGSSQTSGRISESWLMSRWLRDHHELDERWKFAAETCCDPVKKQLDQWVKLVAERPAFKRVLYNIDKWFIQD